MAFISNKASWLSYEDMLMGKKRGRKIELAERKPRKTNSSMNFNT